MPREQSEEKLYAPIVGALKSMFDYWYLPKSQIYSGKPSDKYRPQYGICVDPFDIKNPHLEITAHGEFSEELKLKKFNYYMFEQLWAEQLQPDILGYALIENGKKSFLETIAVEVKAHDLRIRDLMQAKLYETIFGAKHTFLLSPQGMTGEKMEVVLKHNDLLRGNVIIGKCGEDGKTILFDPRLTDVIPQAFRRYCRL
jgi:hypothetical protein